MVERLSTLQPACRATAAVKREVEAGDLETRVEHQDKQSR